jgi:hypothetical protein
LFLARSLRFIYRIFCFVLCNLPLYFRQQVDFVLLTEIGEKYKDVSQFFFYVLEFFCGEIAGLLGSRPKEVFQQLPRFDGEGFGEVLGIVELRPYATRFSR